MWVPIVMHAATQGSGGGDAHRCKGPRADQPLVIKACAVHGFDGVCRGLRPDEVEFRFSTITGNACHHTIGHVAHSLGLQGPSLNRPRSRSSCQPTSRKSRPHQTTPHRPSEAFSHVPEIANMTCNRFSHGNVRVCSRCQRSSRRCLTTPTEDQVSVRHQVEHLGDPMPERIATSRRSSQTPRSGGMSGEAS